MGGGGVNVKVGSGVFVSARVAVDRGVSLGSEGWNGVEVALAFGSTVTRLRGAGGGGGTSGAGPAQEARRVKSKIQNAIRADAAAARGRWFMSVHVLEILAEKVGVIGFRMLIQDSEKIGRGGNFSIFLLEIVLKKGEENIVADALAQVREEMCAAQIDRVGIRAEAAAGINGNIHKSLRLIDVNPVGPPPRNRIRIGVFIKHIFRICGKGFIQPGLFRLIVADLFEPPLMSRFVYSDRDHKIIDRIVVKIVYAAAVKIEG